MSRMGKDERHWWRVVTRLSPYQTGLDLMQMGREPRRIVEQEMRKRRFRHSANQDACFNPRYPNWARTVEGKL
jgi:hypothetical protein